MNSAPNGATNAHRLTALDARYPPRLHCSRNGSASMRNSWLSRKNATRFVLAKITSVITETTW